MIEKYDNIIRKVILRKHPLITDVKVEDEYEGLGYPFIGKSYVVLYKTEECLPDEMMQKIDKYTKSLVRYFPKDGSPLSITHEAKCYFDCGNGYEFRGDLGYKH
jgi:hypothetical protein